MPELKKIKLEIPAHLCYSALVRNMGDEILGFIHINDTWRNRLKLVIDELFMNAVRYGSTEDKSTVFIVFSYHNAFFEFSVEDDGTGSNPISASELKQKIEKNQNNLQAEDLSGRGLSLITSSWADDLKVEPSQKGGIKISFTKKIEANLNQ